MNTAEKDRLIQAIDDHIALLHKTAPNEMYEMGERHIRDVVIRMIGWEGDNEKAD
jgi:hypothetical protein